MIHKEIMFSPCTSPPLRNCHRLVAGVIISLNVVTKVPIKFKSHFFKICFFNQFLFGNKVDKQRVIAFRISSASVSPCPSAVQEQISEFDFAEMNCMVTSIV